MSPTVRSDPAAPGTPEAAGAPASPGARAAAPDHAAASAAFAAPGTPAAPDPASASAAFAAPGTPAAPDPAAASAAFAAPGTPAAPDPAAAALPAGLRLGPVHLAVTDLARSAAWYATALGLHEHRRDAGVAELGDGAVTSVVLVEAPGARRAGRHAGLFHVALLFPSRQELARAAVRLAATRTPVQGASDHGTHEAIYLADPDGNGLELAADRPRERWPDPAEEFAHGPQPLDVEDLLATVAGEQPAPRVGPGLRIGHVHLTVGDVAEGLRFYRDVLGFEARAVLDSAAFVSAGGYHHHLAFNVWRGRGVGPAPADAVGLRVWTVELPGAGDVAAVRARLEAAGVAVQDAERGLVVHDPWGIPLRVTAADGAEATP